MEYALRLHFLGAQGFSLVGYLLDFFCSKELVAKVKMDERSAPIVKLAARIGYGVHLSNGDLWKFCLYY